MTATPRPGQLRDLFWSGGEHASLPRMMACGALVWALYAAGQLATRGVVLDEVVVAAQIIAGAVHYPVGHPHLLFYPQVFSLPNYLWAGMWKLVPNAVILSATRDVLFVFLSLYVPFAFALLLTRRPLWGHFAAVLTLSEAGLRIQGFYPTWVFPHFYTHGHIGLQLAALTVALLLARCWRTGGFLFGLLPAVHAAMALVVWPWGVLYLVLSGQRPQGRDRARLLAAVGAGLALCAALALFLHFRIQAPGAAAPYEARENGEAILRNFTQFSDFHRRPFPFLHFGYFGNLVAFLTLGAVLWSGASGTPAEGRGAARRKELLGVLLLGAVAWAWVYGARLIHLANGAFPSFLEQVMPNRFSNFSSLLLLPLTAAALAGALEAFSHPALPFALVAAVMGGAGVLSALEGISFPWLYAGRTAGVLLFVVWGVVFAMDLITHWKARWRRFAGLAGALVLAGSILAGLPGAVPTVAFTISFVLAACLLAAGTRGLPPQPAGARRGAPVLQALLLTALLLVTGASLPRYRIEVKAWERLNPNDLVIKDWLDHNAGPDELVLTPIYPRAEAQIKTGHPVLMEAETMYSMTYMPRLAGLVGTMMRDLYGMDYSSAERLGRVAQEGRAELTYAWVGPWNNRTLAEWHELGSQYRYRFVLCPPSPPLDLPVAMRSRDWVIYTIRSDTPGTRKDAAAPAN